MGPLYVFLELSCKCDFIDDACHKHLKSDATGTKINAQSDLSGIL